MLSCSMGMGHGTWDDTMYVYKLILQKRNLQHAKTGNSLNDLSLTIMNIEKYKIFMYTTQFMIFGTSYQINLMKSAGIIDCGIYF